MSFTIFFQGISDFINNTNLIFGSFFNYSLEFISTHSQLIAVFLIIIIIFITNLLSQKRFQSQRFGFFRMLLFLFSIYLLFNILNNNSFLESINNYLISLYENCKLKNGEVCQFIPTNISHTSLFIFTYLIFLISTKSRLMWLLTIVISEIYLFTNEQELLYSILSTIPNEHRYLFKGIAPFILGSPILLAIWLFRDNDRYLDIAHKEIELNMKQEEIKMRRLEYDLKKQELKIKQSQFKLKGK